MIRTDTILTIPGMNQADRLEQVRRQSAQRARIGRQRIMEVYARQSMLESLKAAVASQKRS